MVFFMKHTKLPENRLFMRWSHRIKSWWTFLISTHQLIFRIQGIDLRTGWILWQLSLIDIFIRIVRNRIILRENRILFFRFKHRNVIFMGDVFFNLMRILVRLRIEFRIFDPRFCMVKLEFFKIIKIMERFLMFMMYWVFWRFFIHHQTGSIWYLLYNRGLLMLGGFMNRLRRFLMSDILVDRFLIVTLIVG